MLHEIPAPRPVEAYVELRSGDLEVTAAEVDVATVELTGSRADSVVVDSRDDRVSVVEPHRTGFLAGRGDLRVRLTVPTGSATTPTAFVESMSGPRAEIG